MNNMSSSVVIALSFLENYNIIILTQPNKDKIESREMLPWAGRGLLGPRHETFFNNFKDNNAINFKLCNNYMLIDTFFEILIN